MCDRFVVLLFSVYHMHACDVFFTALNSSELWSYAFHKVVWHVK